MHQSSWLLEKPLQPRDQVTKHARAPADTAASDAKRECTRELSALAAQDDETGRAATSHDGGHLPDARWSKDRMVVGCRLEADAQHHDVVDGASSESKPRLLHTADYQYRARRPSRGSRSSQGRRGKASPWPRRAARRAAAGADHARQRPRWSPTAVPAARRLRAEPQRTLRSRGLAGAGWEGSWWAGSESETSQATYRRTQPGIRPREPSRVQPCSSRRSPMAETAIARPCGMVVVLAS